MTDPIESFKRVCENTLEAAELDEAKRLDAARALIDGLRPVESAKGALQFLVADAVDAAALLAVHDLPKFAELQAELRPHKVLKLWDRAIAARTKALKAPGDALDDPALPIVKAWFAKREPCQVCSDGSILTRDGGCVRLAQVHPTTALIEHLRTALGLDVDQALRVFKGRLSIVWGEFTSTLPRENVGRSLANLLRYQVYAGPTTPWVGSKRALGSLVHYDTLQEGGAPVRYGSLDVCGLIGNLEQPETTFQIALRPELAGSISSRDHPEIARMSLNMLTRRCDEAGITDRSRPSNRLTPVRGRQQSWVILSAEYVQSLDLSYDHSKPSDRNTQALHQAAQRSGAAKLVDVDKFSLGATTPRRR